MKKSIFIITLVFTLLLSCSGGGLVAYAADDLYSELEPQFDEQLNKHVTNGTDKFLYYVDCIFTVNGYYTNKYYLRFYSVDSVLIHQDEQGYFLGCSDYNSSELTDYYVYFLDYIGSDSDGWSYSSGTYRFPANIEESSFSYIVSSNHDIYDESGNLVFQKPSDPLGIPRETLTQILTQENPLKEILLLLPMAMVCLVGYVALRKALRTLETILKTA